MIIDFRVVAPKREWIDLKEVINWYHTGPMRGYYETYKELDERHKITTEDVLKGMDEGGVDMAVLQSEWAFGDYQAQNEAVLRMSKKYPKRFVAAYLTVNPNEHHDMAEVIEKGVKEEGFKGVNLQHFAYQVDALDRRFFPVYSKCQDLKVPLTFHSSINFSLDKPIRYSRVIQLDEIACAFPDLIIIANHGGWPWVTEMIAVAWKHPNVYIEIGAISPKYIGTPGSGWEPLMRYGNTLLQDRVLFATDSVIPFKRAVDELKELPLKEDVKKKWLGGNAARLLGLGK
jgi:predicted TIM-barrel fold metal-dependent hydrolase